MGMSTEMDFLVEVNRGGEDNRARGFDGQLPKEPAVDRLLV